MKSVRCLGAHPALAALALESWVAAAWPTCDLAESILHEVLRYWAEKVGSTPTLQCDVMLPDAQVT